MKVFVSSEGDLPTEIKKYQMTVLESTTPTPVVSSVGGISVANGITVSIT